ncbi:alpha/beta hydrolase [bacterium]|nr:alpha/beta hydrolase [bacterium]
MTSATKQQTENWVLIRGLIRSKYHWGNFPEKLKKDLNLKSVECVELAGNGYLADQLTPENIEQALIDLKKQLPSDFKNFGIIGISLGGMLATKWAQLYPSEVSHLVLINSSSSLSPFYKRLNPTQYAGILKNLAIFNPSAIEKFILSATSNRTENWLPLVKDYSEFQNSHPVSLNNFIQQLKLTSQVDFNNVPKSKNLILTSQKDRLVSYHCSKAIAETWACPIEYNSHAGHDLPLDDAPWVIDQIRKHI